MVKFGEDCGSKIIKILSRSSRPLDVQTFVEKLGVNKTTIYRQVERLLKQNVLLEVEFGDGKKRYELKSLDHHHHLVCNKCGKLEDVRVDESILAQVSLRNTKFKLLSHNLEFFGLCEKCNK